MTRLRRVIIGYVTLGAVAFGAGALAYLLLHR
jgi:hypothetical protein